MAVTGGDHDHREHGRQCQENSEVRVFLEMLERLRWTVAGAGKAIGTQTKPGQERNERNVLIDPLVSQDERLANEQRLDLVSYRWLVNGDFVLGKDLINGGRFRPIATGMVITTRREFGRR